jgi:hypothetical protein
VRLLLLLLPSLAFGEIGLKQSGTVIGPVRDINCSADAGLFCTRNTTLSRGDMSCANATAVERGCVSTTTQTFAGDKTFTGRVTAPQFDGGWGNFGSQMLEGNKLTCNDPSNPYLITSYAPDSVTNSQEPALKLKCGSNLTDSDMCFGLFDYAGNRRLGVTEQGNVSFASHITDAGVAGAAGQPFTSVVGMGGPSTGGTPGGAGGPYTAQAGRGGDSAGAAVAGAGGAMTCSAGFGGASSGSYPGGAGGALNLYSGAAGAGQHGGALNALAGFGGNASSGAYFAGTGGTVTVAGGLGGAASGSNVGGDGGSVRVFAGSAGAGTTATQGGHGGDVDIRGGASGANVVGGACGIVAGMGGQNTTDGPGQTGGALNLYAGQGGAAAANPAGYGGDVTISSGTSGDFSGIADGGGGAGSVYINTGGLNLGGDHYCWTHVCTPSGASAPYWGDIDIGNQFNSNVNLGTATLQTVTIGKAGKKVDVKGYGVLVTHTTERRAIETGAGNMTAGELVVTFTTAFTLGPVCTCTHVNTTNGNACNIKDGAEPGTTGVTFAVASGGTDMLHWICVGAQ